MATTQDSARLAVLIDADNAQPSVIEGLLAEVAKLGVASVKRIYGDWTSTATSQWKQILLRYSIAPVQQFAYTKGKNSTDASLIIDAMDLMHSHRFDGFCLVSSDSDYTALARRLREEGLMVFGFGEKKTPDAFVAACDKFIYTEVLRPASMEPAVTPVPSASEPKPADSPPAVVSAEPATNASPARPSENRQVPFDLIQQAIEEESDDSGWAHLSAVGAYIQRIRADFDARLYGSKKLSDLLKRYPKHFLLEERGAPGSASKAVFVRKPPK
jgi:hypothetical protein